METKRKGQPMVKRDKRTVKVDFLNEFNEPIRMNQVWGWTPQTGESVKLDDKDYVVRNALRIPNHDDEERECRVWLLPKTD
jgi:hypothetical protein